MPKKLISGLFLMFSVVFISCDDSNTGKSKIFDASEENVNCRNDDATIIVPEDKLLEYSKNMVNKLNPGLSKWSEATHKSIAYICAKKLYLSEARAVIIRNAAEMPDVYQSGLSNAYNQQWSHAYLYNYFGFWTWGDADDDFHDNIDGDSGESESPEGYNGKWAGYYYERDNQSLGDWYLGYAIHFIQDVSLVLHSTFPGWYMATHHFDFESWIKNNWSQGHNFQQAAEDVSVSSFYTITGLKAAIRTAASNSNYHKSKNAEKAWDAYKESGFPTSVGTGNNNAVYYTKKMIAEATKWAGATIVYTLDKYGQW